MEVIIASSSGIDADGKVGVNMPSPAFALHLGTRQALNGTIGGIEFIASAVAPGYAFHLARFRQPQRSRDGSAHGGADDQVVAVDRRSRGGVEWHTRPRVDPRRRGGGCMASDSVREVGKAHGQSSVGELAHAPLTTRPVRIRWHWATDSSRDTGRSASIPSKYVRSHPAGGCSATGSVREVHPDRRTSPRPSHLPRQGDPCHATSPSAKTF